MKLHRIYMTVTVLILTSLACATLTGGGGGSQPTASPGDTNPPSSPTQGSSGDNVSDSGFPMTPDAYNVTEIGDGSLLYYTKMSLEDVMNFYRGEYVAKGYTEREILTVVEAESGVFSIVFDGDPSGKAVVIQSVDLHDGSRTVSIRLESV